MANYSRIFSVYIMGSASGVLYIGITNDLSRRVSEHKSEKISGFTSQYRVKRLLYFEHFEYALAAIALEKEIKNWGRSKKLALIRTKNPKFADLAERKTGTCAAVAG